MRITGMGDSVCLYVLNIALMVYSDHEKVWQVASHAID